MSALAWPTAIGVLTGAGTLLLVRTGIRLVWDFVSQAAEDL